VRDCHGIEAARVFGPRAGISVGPTPADRKRRPAIVDERNSARKHAWRGSHERRSI
jgi:hypothetical protein